MFAEVFPPHSVGADAERSCSRRRSVTDAACPLRVLIGSFLNPFFSFSARKKRTVSICQEKKGGRAKPEVHPVPPSCDSSWNWPYLPALTHLSAGDYAPHAILMMAGRRHFADTVCRDRAMAWLLEIRTSYARRARSSAPRSARAPVPWCRGHGW